MTLILLSAAAAGWGAAVADRLPAELRRLDPGAPEADRRAAAVWLRKSAAHPATAAALPALERLARSDPADPVRGLAVLAVGEIAAAARKPCPAVVFEKLFDDGDYGGVRLTADMALSRFPSLPPGSLGRLVRYATSPGPGHRDHGLSLLATYYPNARVSRWLLAAGAADPDRQLRHNAHCYQFRATGDLPRFVAYIVRLQVEYAVRPGAPANPTEKDRDEAAWWGMVAVGTANLLAEWTRTRPADLRDALVRALAHPDPLVRGGAAAVLRRLAGGDLPFGFRPAEREGRGVVLAAGRDRLADLAAADPEWVVREQARAAVDALRGRR